MRIHKDKNGEILNIGAKVTFENQETLIEAFKVRSYGYVIYFPNGNAYLTTECELVKPPEPEPSTKTGFNF